MKFQHAHLSIRSPFNHTGRGILAGLAMVLAMGVQGVQGQSADELYDQGRRAYERSDYVNALKNLYAYSRLMESSLKPETRRLVESAIDYSESELAAAVDTRRELMENGRVTQLTVVTSGKIDGETQTKQVAFRMPQGAGRYKPSLPRDADTRGATGVKTVSVQRLETRMRLDADERRGAIVTKADRTRSTSDREEEQELQDRRPQQPSSTVEKELAELKELIMKLQTQVAMLRKEIATGR